MKAHGQPLGELWKDWTQWPIEDRFHILEQIVEIEQKLASTKFMKSGSIYLKKDIPGSETLQTDPPLPSRILEQFTMGPLVEMGLWRGARKEMDLSRGPCEYFYHIPQLFLA